MRMIQITCASLALTMALALTPSAMSHARRTTIVGVSPAHDCYLAVSQGRHDGGAIEMCSLALSDDFLPRQVRAVTYVNRSVLHLRRHESRLALGDANEGIDLQSALSQEDAARAYFYRATANEDLGANRAAYDDYRHAAELSPSWAAPRTELARFQVR